MLVTALAALVAGMILRWPYLWLPLHIDTGFYVSNHTILNRRFSYAEGWNAEYGGCSKALPEWFFSRIYLAVGGARYVLWSRVWIGILQWLTALLVGSVSFTLTGGSEEAWAAGVLIYTVFSAEPQHGIYFESGEQFEVLFQTAAVALLAGGFEVNNGLCIFAGMGLWMFDALFIKLSSLLGLAVALGGILLFKPALS